MMIYLIFAACTITCSFRCFWRNILSPSSVELNLVQVDAEVIGKWAVLICRKVARILANQSCRKGRGVSERELRV
jgi:hypothetical protein